MNTDGPTTLRGDSGTRTAQLGRGVVSMGGPPWRTTVVAWAISVAGTAVLGGAAFYLVLENVWLIAAAGLVSLFAGAAFLGRRTGEAEPLYGALVAGLYLAAVVAFLFGASLLEKLPEPLPGLSIGDSTFFFVWPLLQLVAGVAGSIAGGRKGSHNRSTQ